MLMMAPNLTYRLFDCQDGGQKDGRAVADIQVGPFFLMGHQL